MNKLHNAVTMVLLLGVGLLAADRLRHSGPDRELVRQIEELRKAQNSAALRNDGTQAARHEQYAVPATQAWVQQALRKDELAEMAEKNETLPNAEGAKAPPLTVDTVQTGLERAFYAAPRDRNWGADAEGIVQNALRKTVTEGSHVDAVQCNGALCRIETTHATSSDYQKFVETSLTGTDTGLWNGAAFSSVVRDENGEVTVVSFLAREGTSLPNVVRM